MSLIRSHILVCTGTGCTSSESPKIIAEFEKQLAAQGMDKEAQVVRTGCFGLCALGPIVTIYPEGACYTHVTVDDVEEIVAEHIVKGRIVKRLLNRNEGGDGPATSLAETRFYKHQHRIALRNCGVINPESIDEYIGVDGYAALGKILTEHIPPQQAPPQGVLKHGLVEVEEQILIVRGSGVQHTLHRPSVEAIQQPILRRQMGEIAVQKADSFQPFSDGQEQLIIYGAAYHVGHELGLIGAEKSQDIGHRLPIRPIGHHRRMGADVLI